MPQGHDIKGIIEKVAQIIISELKLEDVTVETFNPDLDLIDELGIDSMDLATIALVLQDEYKIMIDEDDYPKLKTIRLIAGYVEEKISARE
ncbi:MAG: phosphopantetheine-binding protein [Deltaproteobacteria bacterium]|jgi:acyl carrier protein|nr:phosphopantetheine-binding protein [Deltaproteobacteria bacterium]